MVIDKGLYKFFYEKLLYTFAKNEFGEEAIDVRNVKIWDRTTSSGDKTSKKFVASKLLGDGAIKDQRYFYRLYNKFCNSGPLGVVDDLAFCKALEYLGCQIPEGISSRRLSDRAKALFNQFLLLNESDLQRREDIVEEIPSNYLAIVKHLITNEWWFCFRGHSQDKEEENLGWWLVNNIMKFELLRPGSVKVSKIVSRDAVAERYGDCFGFIDFAFSGPGTLAISVKSEHSNLESIHIKLNIGSSRNLDLYLGEFLQQEYDGHIASGAALLIMVPKGVVPQSGQFLIKDPCGLDDEPLAYLPSPFRDVAFYFEDKSINSRRTTNSISSTIEGLRQWKRKATKGSIY